MLYNENGRARTTTYFYISIANRGGFGKGKFEIFGGQGAGA